ncbi:MAG TPA: phosphatidylglycerophosphatase A [Gammaproteobacteria bacterium]
MRPSVRLLRDPVHLLAFGLGAGLAPRAPGTAGSALALLPAWAMLAWPLPWRVAAVAAAFVAGVWLCGASAKRLGVHDHPGIVWDEIVGLCAAALAVHSHPAWLLLAFVLFRLFDVLKPWPIRDADHSLGGGLGIMLDDLLAAAYAAACLIAIQALLPAT